MAGENVMDVFSLGKKKALTVGSNLNTKEVGEGT